jgi:hypothetical protein
MAELFLQRSTTPSPRSFDPPAQLRPVAVVVAFRVHWGVTATTCVLRGAGRAIEVLATAVRSSM